MLAEPCEEIRVPTSPKPAERPGVVKTIQHWKQAGSPEDTTLVTDHDHNRGTKATTPTTSTAIPMITAVTGAGIAYLESSCRLAIRTARVKSMRPSKPASVQSGPSRYHWRSSVLQQPAIIHFRDEPRPGARVPQPPSSSTPSSPTLTQSVRTEDTYRGHSRRLAQITETCPEPVEGSVSNQWPNWPCRTSGWRPNWQDRRIYVCRLIRIWPDSNVFFHATRTNRADRKCPVSPLPPSPFPSASLQGRLSPQDEPFEGLRTSGGAAWLIFGRPPEPDA